MDFIYTTFRYLAFLFHNYIEACEEPTIFRGACKVVSYGYSYHLRENKCLKVRGSGCKVYGNFYQLEKGCRLNCLE